MSHDELDDIAEGCLAAVLEGGETWQRFMADAEERFGLPWAEILELLNERSASRKNGVAA